ncbi:hypothetical protein CK203_060723 [Vitis vinifera]|uniref:PGG domain-containing protein n=1 Tax=Vitis vinifera TaxID=29760 RepID=A0A438GCC9_VITVI|nr:hypothetical protein CK203_060723 [Vitis vinifera]
MDQILEQFEFAMPKTKSLWCKKTPSEEKRKIKQNAERADEKRKQRERKSLTSYNIILKREAENHTGEKNIIRQLMDEEVSKEDKEKHIVALREQGKNHLIVSALITTVTFAAGFTLPGGYKDDNGKQFYQRKQLSEHLLWRIP